MVTAVSGHTARHVEYDLPLAQGLQLQALWLEMQGNETAPVSQTAATAQAFAKAAGLAW